MIAALLIILFLLMIIVGGEKGGKSFFTLVCDIIIILVSSYAVSHGVNIFLALIIACAILIYTTIIFQNGMSIASFSSILSVFIVVIIIGAVIIPYVFKSNIFGFNELSYYEEDLMYLNINSIDIKMDNLIVCIIILSSLGAIMDTSVSISSSVEEIYKTSQKKSKKALIKSGKAISKDIIGTTVNTLFFAFCGESITMLILFIKNKYTFEMLINSKAFIEELSILVFANISCILIIPTTLYLCTFLLFFDKKQVK